MIKYIRNLIDVTMKKTFAIALTSLALMLTGFVTSCGGNGGDTPPTPPTPSKEDFKNVYFDDVTVTYDGLEHILGNVRGAPLGTTITYIGKEAHIDVGSYEATALLVKEGFNDKTLKATLTINKASFENITFADASFEYDGAAHSIYVTGAPSFATVTYSNNGKTDIGTYTVTATISATNYVALTKTATLRITGKKITGITLEDATFPYDGKSHSLTISGELPNGVSVTYTNNTDVGTATITVN